MSVLLEDYKQLEELLENGFDVNNNNYCFRIDNQLVFGVKAIHIAVLKNDVKALKILLRFGSDINALTGFDRNETICLRSHKNLINNRKLSSLHIAVICELEEMVELLLELGAHVNIKDDKGLTPLDLSLDNAIISLFLIVGGADIESANFDPNRVPFIFRAIERQNLDLVKALGQLQRKLVFHQNQTPIEYAMHFLPESVETLISYGFNIFFKNSQTGQSLLHVAISKKNENWIRLLLSKGLNPNSGDSNGNRSLHCAVINKCSPKILLILMESGANPHLKNERGFTPLVYAIRDGNVELTELLFRYGCKLSPNLIELENAIINRKAETALLLLNNCEISLKSISFDSEPIIWFFVKYCVGNVEDIDNFVALLTKLVKCGSDVNSIHRVWGTLMHFLIYAMVCTPSQSYKSLFKALISLPECDLNQVFIPRNTRSSKGEEIFVEQIVANGTPLSFALEMSDCQFFAEQLIKVGANVNTINWDNFSFAPQKVRSLKMLYYSGCRFPDNFQTLFDPQNDENNFQLFLDEPNLMDKYNREFESFIRWIDYKQSNPWSLKHICGRLIRDRFGKKLNQILESDFILPVDLVDFLKMENNHEL